MSKYCTYLKLLKQINYPFRYNYITLILPSLYLKSFCSSIEHMALFNRIKKKKNHDSRARSSDYGLSIFEQLLHRAYFASGSIIATNFPRKRVNNRLNENRAAIVRLSNIYNDDLLLSFLSCSFFFFFFLIKTQPWASYRVNRRSRKEWGFPLTFFFFPRHGSRI